MWELDCAESWVPKNWCFWTVVLEKTLESPLGCKKIKPVNPKGNQPWIFIGRTDAEAKAPVPWPHDVKSQLIRKAPDAGKDWQQKEKGAAEDSMVRKHHQFNRHEFEQTLGDSEGQGSLACYSPWSHKESDTTEWLNNKCWENPWYYFLETTNNPLSQSFSPSYQVFSSLKKIDARPKKNAYIYVFPFLTQMVTHLHKILHPTFSI